MSKSTHMDVNKLDPVRSEIEAIKKVRSPERELDLTDVLKLAEVMVGSMRGFFSQIDTAMYHELNEIADFIGETKVEIARLQPNSLKDKDIPQAGLELEAIVEATEQATDTIMEQAEIMMSADIADPEAYQDLVVDCSTKILEACSFQDITGQRISKVVYTLQRIDERISSLANTLGDRLGASVQPEETEEDRRRREQLLHGPALDGEGISQDSIDKLLDHEGDIDQSDIDALFD